MTEKEFDDVVFHTLQVLGMMYKEGVEKLKINEETAKMVGDRVLKEFYDEQGDN